jgi:hypothetical protein
MEHLGLFSILGIRFESIHIMKYTLILTALICVILVSAQQGQKAPVAAKATALPAKMYNTLSDSCNQLDVTFFSVTASMSMADNKNIRYFNTFVSPSATEKKADVPQDGLIMWQINGREYLTGNLYFSGDSSGYLVFTKNNKEYVNALTPQGAGFLRTHGKKK